MTIIWCMVPETLSMTDRISCYFGPFFALLPHLTTWKIKFWKNVEKFWRYCHFTQAYHKWQSYDVRFLRYEAWQIEFFVILDCLLPFYPLNNTKNQNCEKMIKKPGDIILHMCTKNDNPDVRFLRYWVRRTEFFVILDQFLPLYPPLTTWKIKILKKWKKTPGDIIILHVCVRKMTIIWCMVPKILGATDRIFLHFGPFFAFLPT